MASSDNLLALDIGEKRIGVARANAIARIPEPLAIASTTSGDLYEVIVEQSPSVVVVGLPHNMDGQETAQTQTIKDWVADNLSASSKELNFEIVYADESLSSVKAREQYPGRKHIDDIAACYILQNYLDTSG